MAEFSFEIEEKLLVLSENDKGWTKELNRVSFNGAPAKYDKNKNKVSMVLALFFFKTYQR